MFLREAARYKKNVILQRLRLLRPTSFTFALTNNCNLRCRMCEMWEEALTHKYELTLNTIKNILFTPRLRHLRYITITGGEPFLREDILDIYNCFAKLIPKSKVTICSNGTLTDRIMRFFSNIEDVRRLHLILSFLGFTAHDRITRSKGSLSKLQSSIRMIKKNYPKVAIGIKFVITPWNCSEIENITQYCRKNNMTLFIKTVENVQSYYNPLRYEKNNSTKKFCFSKNQIESIVSSLKKIKGNPEINNGFIEHIICVLEGKMRPRHCFVPQRSLFLTPSGTLYGCHTNNTPLGNICDRNINLLLDEYQKRKYCTDGLSEQCRQCLSVYRYLI